MSRRNFVELCLQLTALDEASYEQTWRELGLSVDWDTAYQTIDSRSQTVAQRGFLHNLARGEAYLAEGRRPAGMSDDKTSEGKYYGT